MTSLRYKILFSADANYVPHLATALYSLFINNILLPFEIVVFTSSILAKDKQELNKLCLYFGATLSIFELEDKLLRGLYIGDYKILNYYRLFATDFISGDKCLYLDSDIIVNGSIKDLYNKNIDNYYLAAVEDPGFVGHEELGLKLGAKYFNSGVMLINLNKWRQVGMKNLVINFVHKNPELIKFVDQCGLNAIVNGDWLEIEREYNCQTVMLKTVRFKNYFIEKKPIIIHFTTSRKPWHLGNKHPYKKLYWAYRKKTSFNSLLLDYLRVKELVYYIFNKTQLNINNRIKMYCNQK